MSVTQQQVLDALAKVASPRGTTLTNANVLSAISVTDGKVFCDDCADGRAQARCGGFAVTGYGCSAAATATSARARRAAGVVASAAAKPGVADVQAS